MIAFEKTIVFEKKLLTVMLTILNETTKFIKTVVFGKKLHATFFNVVFPEVKKLWGS